jgi:hypothetical protein
MTVGLKPTGDISFSSFILFYFFFFSFFFFCLILSESEFCEENKTDVVR